MMFAHLEPIQAKAEGTFAGSMPGYTASRGLRSNPCDVCVSAVEPAGLPKGIDVAERAGRRRRIPELVRADADGDGAGRRQHRREVMATPDHRGQNPMMFAHLEPIQAKAGGTFAGSTRRSGAGRGLHVRGEAAHGDANPVAVCCSAPLNWRPLSSHSRMLRRGR